MLAWNSDERFSQKDFEVYDIPWLRKITDLPFMRYCPISPAFKLRNSDTRLDTRPDTRLDTIPDVQEPINVQASEM